MPDMREEFEAWLPYMGDCSTRRYEKSPDEYDDRDVQVMWIAWQASRAALRVELPGVPDFGVSAEESLEMEPEVYESLEAIYSAEVSMLNRCKKVLQQVGIEVKQ